jgi:hypothetical protein
VFFVRMNDSICWMAEDHVGREFHRPLARLTCWQVSAGQESVGVRLAIACVASEGQITFT